jgi:hypothetical protein
VPKEVAELFFGLHKVYLASRWSVTPTILLLLMSLVLGPFRLVDQLGENSVGDFWVEGLPDLRFDFNSRRMVLLNALAGLVVVAVFTLLNLGTL